MLLFWGSIISAQNLVPNGSFETFSSCPASLNSIGNATGWASATDGSPDYYNSCADASSGADVPANFYGVQTPLSGQGYAGFLAYAPDNSRDYISLQLPQSLMPGKSYCVSFNVSLADFTFTAVQNVGMYFSTSQVSVTNGGLFLGLTPQIIHTTGPITDKSENWVTVSGLFTADAPHQWITIGNFASNANSTIQDLSIPGVTGPLVGVAYYYLDNVEIYELPPFEVTIGPEPVLCEAGIFTLTAEGGDSYTWARQSDPFTILGTGSVLQLPLNTTTPIIVTATNGLCKRQQVVTPVVLAPTPVIDFIAVGTCVGSATSFIDVSTNLAPGSLYEWDFDDDGLPDAFTFGGAAFTYTQAGTYTITLTVYTLGGYCQLQQTKEVVIAEECNPCEDNAAFINYVPNPLVEYYTQCPTSLGQIGLASPWFSPTTSSPDFLHACNAGIAGMPSNSFGVTQAYSGNGYLGIYSFGNNYREYVSTPLSQTLLPGQTYCVSFKVHLSTLSGKATDNLGAYFSADAIGLNIQSPLYLTPHIANPNGNIIDEDAGWVIISGNYTPTNPVSYITIGNFTDDTNSQSINQPNPSAPLEPFAYYYVDNISVSPLPEIDLNYPTMACINTPVTLTVLNNFCSIEWYETSNPSVILSNQPSLTVETATTGTRQYTVWAQYGQCLVSKTVSITFNQAPTIGFDVFANCAGGATVFTDVSNNVLPGALYQWDFNNDGITDNVSGGSVAYIYPTGGLYLAKLTIINPGGCQSAVIQQVVIENCNQYCDANNILPDGNFEQADCPDSLGDADLLDFWQTPGTGSCATFTNPCLNVILQSITPNPNGSNTFSFSVTNLCPQRFVFASFELPSGTGVDEPANNSTYNGIYGDYIISQPVFAPFNAILYFDPNNETSGFNDGQTEIFTYTLPSGVAIPPTMQFLIQLGTSLSLLGTISTQTANCLKADLFSTCTGESDMGVPQNFYGSQLPFVGNNYIGLAAYSSTPAVQKQYITTHLDAPLVVGQQYCVTMYVSLADNSQFAVTDMGLYFSTTPVNEALNLTEAPQVYNDAGNYLFDSQNWVPITGMFTATQPYEYLTIGNFAVNNDVQVSVSPSTSGYAYYYIDNVIVSPVSISAPTDLSVCINTPFTLTANANTCETYWYALNNPSGILSVADQLTTTITDTTVFVVAGKNGACVVTDTVTVFPQALPTADAGEDVEVCLGQSVQLQASGGDTYEWLPLPNASISNPNLANPFVTGFELGNFYFKVIVTDETTGCQAIDSVRVKTLQLPTANILEPDTLYVCANEPVTLNATGGTGGGTSGIPYQWSPSSNIIGNPNVANPIVFVSDTTTFFLTVTNTFTGCQDVAQVVLIPRSIYTYQEDTITICSGEQAVLNPLIPEVNITNYGWLPNINLSSDTIANPTTFATSSTTYTLTYTDEWGCVGQSAVFVRVVPRPNAGSDIAICQGGFAQLFASGGGLSYSWSPTLGLSNPNSQNPVATPTETTTYTVTVIYPGSDETDCDNTDSVTVIVNNSGFAFAGNDVVICQGESIQLNAIGGSSYAWSPVAGLSNPNIANPTATPSTTTLYTVTVTDDLTGCQSVDDVLVTVDVPSLPVINTPSSIVYCTDPLVPVQVCYDVTYSGCAPLLPNIVTQLSSSVTVNSNLCFTYVSAFATNQTDTVTLQLCAGSVGCDQIEIIIVNCDTAPVWSQPALSVSTCINSLTSFELPPVFNFDGPNDVLNYTAGTPLHGSVILSGTTVNYTPNPGYIGTDFFEITVCDSFYPFDDCATLPITINVFNNSAPIAPGQSANVEYETPTTICLNIIEPDEQTTSLFVASSPVNGSLSITNSLCVAYTPNPGFTGTDVALINVCDPCGSCTLMQLLLNVQPQPNVAPVSPDIVVNIPFNTTQEICLDVFDGNGDPTTTQLISGTVNGTLIINPTGNCITFTPDPGFSGANVIVVNVCDPFLACDEVTITLVVAPAPNLPPIVANTTVTTNYNTSVFICPNIVEPNGNPYNVGVTIFPTNGTVSQPSVGCFIYTPINFSGTDSFTIIVCDNLGLCTTATVTINVLPPTNQPPLVPDLTVIVPNATQPVNACLSIVEPEGNSYTTTVLNNGIFGVVNINNPDCFTYTPGSSFTNFDVAQLLVCDEFGACTQVNVFFTTNAPPSFNSVTVSTLQNTPVDVCLSITDPENEDFTISVVSGSPANGSATINPPNCLTYSPNTGFLGTDQISIQVCDVNGNCSVGTVTVNVVPSSTNLPPSIEPSFTFTPFNTAVTVCVVINDPEGDALTTVFGNSVNGTVFALSNTCFTYVPNLNYTGTDVVTVSVCDVLGNCNTGNAFISVLPNLPPSADNVLISTNAGQSVQACIDPTDPEGDATSINISATPANGTAIIINENCITYTPATGFTGTDEVQLLLCDVFNNCQTVTITIIVASVNSAPIVTPVAPIYIPLGGSEEVCIEALDPNGDNLTYTILTPPTTGTATVVDNCLQFNAPQSGTGNITVTLQVCDDGVPPLCTPITITFILNTAPTAAPQTVTIPQNTATSVCLTIIDPEDNDYTITIFQPAQNGTSNLVSECVEYTPNPTFVGTDIIIVQLCDVYGACSTTTITIIVTDAFVLINDSVEVEDNNAPITINVLENDTYPEGSEVVVTITDEPNHGTAVVNPDGTITYTPNPGFTGTDTIVYEVCHPDLGCEEAVLVITVNNALAAYDDTDFTTFSDVSVNIPILANDVFPNLDGLTVTIINTGNVNGFVSQIGTTGVFSYLPASGFTGVDTFQYIICYPTLGCDSALVVVTVLPAPQYPNAVDDNATTNINVDVVIDVLANDTNPLPGDLVVVSITDFPQNGTATINANQTITYAPNAGFSGNDVFTYVICNPNYGDGQTICDTATVFVTVINPIVCIPKAYEALSPNGDGRNDFFVIDNIDCNGYDKNELTIFNRWGNIVFETKNYGAPNWWNGTFKETGNVVPAGTYFYLLKTNSGEIVLQGYIEVNP